MVCRNCGADLKPGIKYCLECGNYIDDDEYGFSESGTGTMSGGGKSYKLRSESVTKKRKKNSLRPVDILIYAGLSLIIIVSIIIIIITLVLGGREVEIVEPQIETGEVVINLSNYEITLPRALNYDLQGNILYVSDGANYTFSYKNTADDYYEYANDANKLTQELQENNYEVLSIDKQTVNGREFIICEIRVNGRIKYLYLTPLDNATSMGVIEVYETGNWDNALGVIADINNSIIYDGVKDNTYNSVSPSESVVIEESTVTKTETYNDGTIIN